MTKQQAIALMSVLEDYKGFSFGTTHENYKVKNNLITVYLDCSKDYSIGVTSIATDKKEYRMTIYVFNSNHEVIFNTDRHEFMNGYNFLKMAKKLQEVIDEYL